MFSNNTRILLADDSTTTRALIKSQLRAMGFIAFADANNGENALAVLHEQLDKNEPIQLILSDWNMPVITGIELLKKVRSIPEFKALPFLLITAESEADQVKEAIDSGVSGYIRKPFSPAVLQEKILAVWKKHNL